MMTTKRLHARIAMAVGVAAAIPTAALAQSSYPVVQSTAGAAGSRQLNAALSRLAANPRDVSALLDAGNAALILGDTDAALGFLSRADQVSPNNPRVKAALAGALVRNENPYDALAYFEQAERAGASVAVLAGDRGLAYDLVGDNTSAQRYYQQALSVLRSDEVVRRYALSQAIGGDRKGAEATLAPLLQRQDPAAWRTRAFVLAIAGEAVEAEKVVNATMPRHLATSITPYLRYMPRLTPAQQAAAANFGQFPRAAQIGQDDPRAARYAVTATPMGAGSRLKPAGEPLGRRRTQTAKAPAKASAKPAPTRVAAAKPTVATTGRRTPLPSAPIVQQPAPARVAVAQQPAPVRVAVAQPTAVPRPATSTPQPIYGPLTSSAGIASPAVTTTPLRPIVVTPAPITSAQAATPPVTVANSPPAIVTPSAQAVELPAIAATPAATAPAAQPGLADLFSDYRPPAEEQQAPVIAVDLSAIKPRRETPAIVEKPNVPLVVGRSETRVAATTVKTPTKGAAKPAAPANPSRIWVQLGVGGDKTALAFDWRRLNKANAALFKGRTPSTTPLRATNRLLTGPFATEAEAKAFVEKLKKAEIDALLWTSPAGQAVDALKL